jgi:MYXO-CTERM domain-containing protein
MKGGEATRCFVTTGCSYGSGPAGGAGLLVLGLVMLGYALVRGRRQRRG